MERNKYEFLNGFVTPAYLYIENEEVEKYWVDSQSLYYYINDLIDEETNLINGKNWCIIEPLKIKGVKVTKENPDKYVLVEDSGLVVVKLNGLPGAYSARFHSIEIDESLNVVNVPEEKFTTDKSEHDKKNNERLLELVKNIPFEERAAYFEVCFCMVKNGEILFTTSARSNGFINDKLVGNNGFGYDPLFVGNDTFGKTYAELDSNRKNLRSHRKVALKDLALWLTQNIKTN